jgi:redox-sensing transcriptional repressor
MKKDISRETLKRLPLYWNYLKSLKGDPPGHISATNIATALDLYDVQVRKDLACVSSKGKPKIGYDTQELILDIEQFLGYSNQDSAALVGVGNMGRALLSYGGFRDYGLDICVAFDADPSIVGSRVNGKEIQPVSRLRQVCQEKQVRIGIITVPADQAQKVCRELIEGGALAIWNFAPVNLKVPEGILVHNENMAVSLALLSKHLSEKLEEGV